MRLPPALDVRRYGFAALAVAGATILALAAESLSLPASVGLLAFPVAALVAARHGGAGPGVLASALGVAACAFFLMPPLLRFRVEGLGDRRDLVLMASASIAVCGWVGALQGKSTLAVKIANAVGKSEVKYKLMFERNPDPMWTIDAHSYRFQTVNQAAIDLYGYSRDEVQRMTVMDLRPPEDIPLFLATAAGNPLAVDIFKPAVWRQRTKDGRIVYVDVRANRLLVDGRDSYLALARDVSEQVQMEAALRDAEENWRALLDYSLDYFLVLDDEDRIRFVNRPFLGVTPEDARGRQLCDVLPPERVSQVRAAIRRARALGEGVTFDSSMPMADGTVASYEVRCLPIKRKSPLRMLMVVCHDTTKACRQADELRCAKDAAEAASHAKDRFIASLSHELRAPLTPIIGGVELAERQCPELAPILTIILRNAQREARLIDDLLDVSRIVSGKLSLKPEWIDVQTVVDRAIEPRGQVARTKGVHVDVESRPGQSWVRGDPDRLVQVVGNLLDNAIKFTPEGGTVTVRSDNSREGHVAIRVSDTGRGIAPADIARIFRPFEQVETAYGGGLGLGLAISKGIVEASGGQLVVESGGLERGATFTISLPIVTPTPQPRPPEPRPTAAPLRILLVEDDADTRTILSQLMLASGRVVETADSLASAVACASTKHFDLIVSDLGLPDGSGLELMAKLEQPWPAAIALSGYGTEEDVRRSKVAGFKVHLTKPVTSDRLDAAIHEVAG